jgi:hypothetical protein
VGVPCSVTAKSGQREPRSSNNAPDGRTKSKNLFPPGKGAVFVAGDNCRRTDPTDDNRAKLSSSGTRSKLAADSEVYVLL